MLYYISAPMTPPYSNHRLKAADAHGKFRRDKSVDRFQGPFGAIARCQLARQGLAVPFDEPVLALYLWQIPRGRRDWDASIKDTQDSLNGIAWVDDRRVVTGPGIVVTRTKVRRTEVWFTTLADGRSEWLAMLGELLDRYEHARIG